MAMSDTTTQPYLLIRIDGEPYHRSIYVCPETGSDWWPGTLEKPLRTFAEAMKRSAAFAAEFEQGEASRRRAEFFAWCVKRGALK